MDSVTADNVQLAKKALSHLDTEFEDRGGNVLEPLFDSFADDIVFHVPCDPASPRYGEPAIGKQAVMDLFLSDQEFFEDVEIERPLEFLGSGDRIVVLFALRYTIKKTGETFRDKEVALVIDFRDGKVGRMTEIQDMTPWCVAYPSEHTALT